VFVDHAGHERKVGFLPHVYGLPFGAAHDPHDRET